MSTYHSDPFPIKMMLGQKPYTPEEVKMLDYFFRGAIAAEELYEDVDELEREVARDRRKGSGRD